jgi:hypothetical protein
MMMKRGQIQLRGRLRWKVRRLRRQMQVSKKSLDGMPIIFGNAIPKCGSKLLFNILRTLPQFGPCVDTGLNEIKPIFRGQLTNQAWINNQLDSLRPGDIRFGYLYSSQASIRRLTQPGWATFMIIRDPRDQVISEVFYALEMHAKHGMHEHLKSLPDMDSRLEAMIVGVKEGLAKRVGVREHYHRFLPWLKHPGISIIRFEDLIQKREATLSHILDRLESTGFSFFVDRDEAMSKLLEAMKPAKSETFREGKSGRWAELYSPEIIALFKREAGDLLVELEYESGLDW